MNIISCDYCGVLLDVDKLSFPTIIYREDGSIDGDRATWNGQEWVAKVQCPVCESDVCRPT